MVSLRSAIAADIPELRRIRDRALKSVNAAPFQNSPPSDHPNPGKPIHDLSDTSHCRILVAETDHAIVAWAIVYLGLDALVVLFTDSDVWRDEVRAAIIGHLQSKSFEAESEHIPIIVY